MRRFLGNNKTEISGQELSVSSVGDVRRSLSKLSSYHLIDETSIAFIGEESVVSYAVHPAVRDRFLAKLDAGVQKLAHRAASEELDDSLSHRPGEDYPSSNEILDQLEEITYHLVQASMLGTASSLYRNRLGGRVNLGDKLGQHERGRRICLLLLSNEQATRELMGLKPFVELLWDLAEYSRALGLLDDARIYYRRWP